MGKRGRERVERGRERVEREREMRCDDRLKTEKTVYGVAQWKRVEERKGKNGV